MSLVICSNIRDDTRNRETIYEAPFSFHNALKQTLQIPPNSEVAVQSVKINKAANLFLKKTDIWYQYFGKDLNLTNTTSDDGPYRTIYCTPDILGDEKLVSMEEFVDIMERSINVGMPHPDIYSKLKFESVRDGTTNAYVGFKITSDGQNDSGSGNKIETNTDHFMRSDYWQNTFINAGVPQAVAFTPDALGPKIVKNSGTVDSTEGCMIMNAGFPLSHMGGVFKVDCTGMRKVSSPPVATDTGYGQRPFQVGLCRSILLDDAVTNVLAPESNPAYYNFNLTTGLGVGGTGFEANYFDVVVSCEQQVSGGNYKLKVHQATRNPAGSVSLEEVVYYGYAGALHANILDLSQTGVSGINLASIVFTLENEILNIDYINDSNTTIRICGFTADLASGAKKENLICPMGQTRWNLYPKLTIVGGPSVPNTSFLQIKEFNAHINTYNNFSQRNPDNNFFTRLESLAQDGILHQMDTRDIYDMTVNPTLAPAYTPEGIGTGSGPTPPIFLKDRQTQYIFAPSETLYKDTPNANMAAILGFNNDPVLAPSINGVVSSTDAKIVVYTSDSESELLSTASLFVRLDNFTQTSYNAGVGRPSKILYHLPRFDTSNRDLGTGLYFEPTERTYVALNNSDTIYANSMNISISNDNEQLATDLVGKTIVVLHFRKHGH